MHVPLGLQPADPFKLHLQSLIDKKQSLLTIGPSTNCHKEILSYISYLYKIILITVIYWFVFYLSVIL